MACWVLMAISLGLTSCSLFSKKQTASTGGRGGGTDARADRGRAGAKDATSAPAGVNGILAGQVVDNFNGRPQGAYIQVIPMQDGQKPAGAPIEVAADAQGYFTIQGLEAGRHYRLVARVKDAGRVLAGAN